jgi:bifunctional DNA-binding transcriptional regulator/antitoxin component of YhaV-PrlF toxin-antitoxin module
MHVVTLTDDEHVKVPRPIQEALGVRPGDRIGFEVHEDGTVVVRADRLDLMSLRGILKPKVQGVTVEHMNETIQKVAGGA